MANKSVELAIFWLPLISGVLLGGIAGSAWYGGDKIPAIWIAFFGIVCLLLTGALQVQQYTYANVLQPEIELKLPQNRFFLSWNPPKEFNFVTRAEDQPVGQNGQTWSPVVVLNNKSNVFGQDAVATWSIAPIDNAEIIKGSDRLKATCNASINENTVAFFAKQPITAPVGIPFKFPVSFKQTVPIPFLSKRVETFIPYNVWSEAILFFIATLPPEPGSRSQPIAFEVSLDWNIPEGNKTSRFKVTAVATNTTLANSKPSLSASIELTSAQVQ